MRIRKILCCLLAAAMLMAGCSAPAAETTAPQTTPETTPTTLPVAYGDGETSPTAEVIEDPVENPITYFSISMGEDFDHICYLVAYEDQGETYVEYMGQVKKAGRFGLSLLHRLTEQVSAAELAALDGRSEYAAGESLGSLFVSYLDGTCLQADFTGAVPQEFTNAYQLLDAWFAEQTGELPIYEPQPEILGDVDADVLAEMLAILEVSGIVELDLLCISDIPLDDYFVFTAGLSSDEGILNGTQCNAMMMTTPYAFVIVTVRDERQVEAVREDFHASMDWHKWVCVMPTDALIAQKGNMVLCLMGNDIMYDLTVAGIENSGWTQIETFRNPDM